MNLRNLNVRFNENGKNNKNNKKGEISVLDDFSLNLADIGVTALFGKSGCGKTTLINVISGLVSCSSGEILSVPENISYIFQEDRLIPWINVLHNVLVVSDKRTDKLANSVRAEYLLGRLGLSEDIYKYPDELSGGMKRRVNIARAFMRSFDLLIMDEPFKGLDMKIRNNAMTLVREEIGEKPVIFVSHDIDEVLMMADEVFIFDGTPLKIINNFRLARNLPLENLREMHGSSFNL